MTLRLVSQSTFEESGYRNRVKEVERRKKQDELVAAVSCTTRQIYG